MNKRSTVYQINDVEYSRKDFFKKFYAAIEQEIDRIFEEGKFETDDINWLYSNLPLDKKMAYRRIKGCEYREDFLEHLFQTGEIHLNNKVFVMEETYIENESKTISLIVLDMRKEMM